MKGYQEEIGALLAPVVEAQGMELILVECLRMKTRWLVRLYIDREEGGVDLDDCCAVSDLVGDILDVHDLPPGPYTLEVSSPGLERPLARDKDFLRFRGRRVRVKTDRPIGGARNFCGELRDYRSGGDGMVLVLQVGDRTYEVPREAVLKANLEYVGEGEPERKSPRHRPGGKRNPAFPGRAKE
ncbi:MAG TPA: ribosome maturation factor RimP [Syntrophales bacterium]|nr:ribosome maturation factor RimP [Syntrophales bacterium]HOM06310.1 ribosome maturation factor RimP [Syntrophales bacterium]HON99251.1 ribosome maturation factor RimP [Syntrophales bacterium]HPC00076.1 ribosome maturation factor RimP [Syntrophales bacterium]HPQ05709.1 ribosome maturation factor RimP [Syntrophales bacterium]